MLGDDDQSALICAVHNKNLEAVEMLLKAGADPCVRTIFGGCAMRLTKNFAIRELLVEYGAEVDDDEDDLEGDDEEDDDYEED